MKTLMKYYSYESNRFQIYGNDQGFQIAIYDIFSQTNPCNEVAYVNFDFNITRNLYIAKNPNIPNYALKLMVDYNMIIINDLGLMNMEMYLKPAFLLKLL